MKLTTTSYAILGHLALRPWTMYDLAQQARRNLRYYFPRAESQLYAEPKRLVRLGLATARKERVGKRARTVYEVTPAGRRALLAWLADPVPRGPVLEFEAILRVMLSPLGDDADLRRVLLGVRAEIAVMLELADAIRGEYQAGTAPFQRHIVHRSIMHDFLCSFAELVDDWAARSLSRVDKWGSQSVATRTREAMAIYRAKPTPGRKPFRGT